MVHPEQHRSTGQLGAASTVAQQGGGGCPVQQLGTNLLGAYHCWIACSPEYARACGIEALEPLGVYLPGDKNYPGGWLFDPLGLSKDGSKFDELAVKEIKNGRLAMVAWLGFAAQAAVTRQGPVANLLEVLPQ